jgi:hypothetical protein
LKFFNRLPGKGPFKVITIIFMEMVQPEIAIIVRILKINLNPNTVNGKFAIGETGRARISATINNFG